MSLNFYENFKPRGNEDKRLTNVSGAYLARNAKLKSALLNLTPSLISGKSRLNVGEYLQFYRTLQTLLGKHVLYQ